MKKTLFAMLITAGIFFASCNNSAENKSADTKKEETPAAKTEDAKPAMASEKEHVCTDKCKDGTHLYAHGEKGHTCTDECKKM